MDYHQLAGQARAESVLLGLLSKSLFRPTSAFAGEIRSGLFLGDLRGLFSDEVVPAVGDALHLLEDFTGSVADKSPEDVRLMLEVDYNRLFVGPGALLAPPYESFYESSAQEGVDRGTLRGPAERAVLAEYRAHDLTMPEEFIELPDHIAVELEYLSFLASREASAWDEGDGEEALRLQADSDGFRSAHLGTWAGEFSENVVRSARTAFYKAIGLLLPVVGT